MAEFDNNDQQGDIFAKAVRAGKRTYFFDVRSTRSNEYYLTITESKKRFNEGSDRPFFEKHKITNFRCYLTAQNLATFTGYSGFTPELSEGDPLKQGIELNAYPSTRTFAFGVNLTL